MMALFVLAPGCDFNDTIEIKREGIDKILAGYRAYLGI
jgi:hypothetical protein